MQRRVWYRVNAPRPWRPKQSEELVGAYIGSKIKLGQWGEYRVHYVKSRNQVYYVSGAIADNLFSLVAEGLKVKLVFAGVRQGKEHEYKVYELYTEEAIKLAEVG